MEEISCAIGRLVLLESAEVAVALLLIDSECGVLVLAARFDVSIEEGNSQLLVPRQLL